MKGRNPYVIHYVHDMDRAKRFYMEVFDVKPSFESEGWTTLDFGSLQLALHIAGEPDDPLLRCTPSDVAGCRQAVIACDGSVGRSVPSAPYVWNIGMG